MISEYVPVGPAPSDAYELAPTEIDVIRPGSPVVSGRAVRCGITRPFYENRSTYVLFVGRFGPDGREPIPGVWVYDGGRFVEVNAWHRDRDSRLDREAR